VPAAAIALVLVAAVLHAGWNRLLHLEGDRAATMVVASAVGGLVLLPWLVLTPPRGVALLLLLSVVAQTAYVLGLSAAYAEGSLAVAYPIARGTAPFLVTLGAWAVLHERPTLVTALGAVGLLCGLVLVASAGHRLDEHRAIVLAVVTGICIAAYSTIDARAVRSVEPLGYLSAQQACTAVALFAIRRPSLERVRASARPGIAVGVGSTLAYLLVLFAFRRAGAGNVATLRETSVLLAAVFAGTRLRGRTLAGAGLIAAGAILAAVG
jgi:drug/metabolite transporter (DMT)-like permease